MKMSTAHRARLTGPAAVLAGVTALTVAGVAAPAGASPLSPGATHPHVRNGTVTVPFTWTGTVQHWVVPAGVASVFIDAGGAAGQDNSTGNAQGANGAEVTNTVAVTPGTTLDIYVGDNSGIIGGGGSGPGNAGNGGGASDVRPAGGGLSSRLIVAAGGGGAGGDGHAAVACAGLTNGFGGDGGVSEVGGAAGTDCNTAAGGDFGDGATLGGGGAGGSSVAGCTDGTAGSLGTGGGGGTVCALGTNGEGGGGGGGYYGGGGGESGNVNGAVDTGGGGGGGGGSNFGNFMADSNAANTGWVDITYGTPSAPLSILTGSPLPGGTKGHSYSMTLAATGGTPGYTWSLIPGSSLPAGLTLSSGGAISGTPTATGTKTFTVEVRDSVGATADKTFSLTIGGTASDLAILLSHEGVLRHDRNGKYLIEVANTNSSATSVETHVSLLLPSGLRVVQGGKGTFWQCRKTKHSSFCSRNAKINAHDSTTITVKVKVTAAVGKRLKAKAIVSPSDSSPDDNTSVDVGIVRG
jgi:putative Ig domain-containing protein